MASALSRTAWIASSTSVLVIERIASRSSTSSRPIRSALLAGASDTEYTLTGSAHLLRGERRRKGSDEGECGGDQLSVLLAEEGVGVGVGAARDSDASGQGVSVRDDRGGCRELKIQTKKA